MSAPRSLLDEVLPRFDAREVHDIWVPARPEDAKAAIAFLVRPERGGSRVITETRLAGRSPEATRALLRYWRAIRLGSGAIRRSWLAGIRRHAVRTVTVNAGRD